jgi:hypothetical protein
LFYGVKPSKIEVLAIIIFTPALNFVFVEKRQGGKAQAVRLKYDKPKLTTYFLE